MRKISETFFKGGVVAAGVLPLVSTLAIFLLLLLSAYPLFKETSFFAFLFGSDWTPNKGIYGAIPALTGTIAAAFLALIPAVPIGIGAALFITQLLPPRFRMAFTLVIDTLAAIPSIIYGLWGILVLVPFSAKYVQPLLSATIGKVPLIGSFFTINAGGGLNLFTASIVLSIMVIPFIASLARESILLANNEVKEAAYGLGATSWEVIHDVILPLARPGLVGGIFLALSRALGETMAVAYVIGNNVEVINSFFDPATTVSALIANEFTESDGIHQSALIALALVLLLMNFLIFAIAKYTIKRKSI